MSQATSSELARIANQLRIHSITSTTKAGSGHPTTCLSAADIVSVLFFSVMRYFPNDPKYPNNDRFVLSKGHAAPILYAAWAEAGFFPVENLSELRTLNSDLEGHPTPRLSFVDVSTGSLGQGLSVGVGMALAAKLDGLSYRTYVLMGDGEIAEGSVWEAVAMASHYHLDNLVGIVDVNRLGQSQHTMLAHDVDVYRNRFEAFGWKTLVVDGHNIDELLNAFGQASLTKCQPLVIIAKTFKGYGVSFVQDHPDFHGKPLSGEQMDKALEELQPNAQSAANVEIISPEMISFEPGVESVTFPDFSYAIGEKVATRKAYGAALERLGAVSKNMVVLDGDVKNSTFAERFAKVFPDRYVECYIAEQNMVGVGIGLAARGKIPFISTFAAFLTRAFDQIRMAGVSFSNIKIFGSHVGVSIGQDGVSQMGLEDIAMMRCVYGSVVLYPSDAVSMERLMEQVLMHKGLVYIRGTRPDMPVLYNVKEQFPIGGFKVPRSSVNDTVTVVAAGITLHEALKAYDVLAQQGIHIRVIDLYSIKPLDTTGLLDAAKNTNNRIITVEDHYSDGGIGDAVSAALSEHGVSVYKLALRELPHSGKPEELLKKYGIDAQAILKKVSELI